MGLSGSLTRRPRRARAVTAATAMLVPVAVASRLPWPRPSGPVASGRPHIETRRSPNASGQSPENEELCGKVPRLPGRLQLAGKTPIDL